MSDDKRDLRPTINSQHLTTDNQEHTTNIDSDTRQSTLGTRQPRRATTDNRQHTTNTPAGRSVNENAKIQQSGWKLAKNAQISLF